MKITFLGTGTSQGVPVIGCECEVCKSNDTKDIRFRTSAYFEVDDVKLVIDTGPDFRSQLLANNINDIDAILFTHPHKDHIAGMDDVRPICHKHDKDIPIFGNKHTIQKLKEEFYYCFDEKYRYPGIPRIKANIVNQAFNIKGLEIIPIEVLHYKLPIYAYRIKDVTYITDANYISSHEMEKIRGSKIIIINALQKTEHISHYTLDQALEVLEELKPEKAFLTHISHQMGLHEEVEKELPTYVKIAYDGLSIKL